MSTLHTQNNGAVQCCVAVRQEPSGQFTAHAVGFPDIHATAGSRQDAIARIQEALGGLLASEQLVVIDVLPGNSLLNRAGQTDPHDPDEQAYLEALARGRQEDLDSTLRELDQQCSNSSLTPIT